MRTVGDLRDMLAPFADDALVIGTIDAPVIRVESVPPGASELFQRLWTKAANNPEYVKDEWKALQRQLHAAKVLA